MSSPTDYPDHVTPDPNDATHSIITFKMKVDNAIFAMGGIEIVAQSLGWLGDGNPMVFMENWWKQQSVNGLRRMAELAAEQRRDEVNAQIDSVV